MNAFEILVKPIRRLIEISGFEAPTESQEKAIPIILEGKNVLLISPTATGKTEAAVFPVLNMLLKIPKRSLGIKILYITPLKALNRDLLERLEGWCSLLDVKVAVRHGDTGSKERRKQALNPPDMLITTPETLQAILPGRVMSRHLQHVRFIIVDEVHEIADSKRGSHLSLALERLRLITNREFQLVGLSATIGSPKKIAQLLVGNGRSVEIVRVSVARLMKLKVLFPQPTTDDYELASSLFTHPEVAARLRVVRQIIENQKSVLLFTNTRAASEVLTSRLKVWDVDFPVSIHHGSIAKLSRVAAERGLKDGELKGLVATSSLELGIDVGRIDMVIQYMSPRQVTRLIQRVGRSGHRIGRVAQGIIITMDSEDTLEAMVIANRAYKEDLEPVDIPPNPYDALAHQIAGLFLKKSRWYFFEILDLFKNAYPYANLTIEDIRKILNYMHSRFPRLAWVYLEEMVAIKPYRTKPLYEYYFENLSMIPYVKQYIVIDDTTDTAVGVLDEAFVAEYGKPEIKFIIRGSPWKILTVSDNNIYVKPVDDPTGAIPSWVGEEIPVPFEVAREVGWIRGFIEDQTWKEVKHEEIAAQLSEMYPADMETILRATFETAEHVKKGYLTPTDKRIALEDWDNFSIIHANFGSLTNRSLAQLIGLQLSEQIGYTIEVQHDPYRILIRSSGAINTDKISKILSEMKEMGESAIQSMLIRATIKTGLFKRRMVHVARRVGALEKWADFSKITLQNLIKSFEGTIIYEEALKETLTTDFDLKHTLQIFEEIQNGKIEIIRLKTHGPPTPITRVAIERANMKTDLIPPKRMKLILVESTKARLLNEIRTLLCVKCWEYYEVITIKDLPDKPKCPKCESKNLAIFEEEDRAISLIEKKGKNLTKKEQRIYRNAIRIAELTAKQGKPAFVALSARKIKISDVKDIFKREKNLGNHFFELVLDAERKALKRRFW